jgi:hypothetical protein
MSHTWIRVELVPLPISPYPSLLLYWNPDSGELVGNDVAIVERLIQDTLVQGLPGVELTDPYRKVSEFAAILSQQYVLIPEPVSEVPTFASVVSHSLH